MIQEIMNHLSTYTKNTRSLTNTVSENVTWSVGFIYSVNLQDIERCKVNNLCLKSRSASVSAAISDISMSSGNVVVTK